MAARVRCEARREIQLQGRNFLQSKMFLGGVSLCISLLLWSLVALDNNAESARTMRDEIEYRNLGAGYSVNAPVKEVEIKLEGKINELSGIEPSDIVSEVDLANLRTGRYTTASALRGPDLRARPQLAARARRSRNIPQRRAPRRDNGGDDRRSARRQGRLVDSSQPRPRGRQRGRRPTCSQCRGSRCA